MKFKSRLQLDPWALLFDVVICIGIGIWLLGGISFQNHLYLRHGADPRRVSILLAVLGYLIFPHFREKSFILLGAKKIARALEKPRYRWGGIFAVACFAAILEVFQTRALRVPLYDVGIFHQILWSISHGQGFHSTISGAGNFLMDHLSLSLVLPAPFFRVLGGSAYFLPVLQVVLIFGGVSAWVYFASQIEGVSERFRSLLAAATTVFALSFESLWGNLRWGFHENAIAFFCMSWALALLGTQWKVTQKLARTGVQFAILVLFFVAAGSKEILLLNIGLVFICWFFYLGMIKGGLKWKIGLSIMALFLFSVFIYFEKLPHPADKNYFDRYYSYLGHSLGEFAKNLFFHPTIVIHEIGAVSLLRYFFLVFSPWLFLPLALLGIVWKQKKSLPQGLKKLATVPWVLCILPSFASAALATYPPLRGGNFHYVLELWPILAFCTILGLSIIRSEKLLWVWALIGLFRMDFDPVGDLREYVAGAQKLEIVRTKLADLPESLNIVADELAGTWVAGRNGITRWPDTMLLPDQCPDLILVRNAIKGSFVEMGVRETLTRCESNTKATSVNSDLRPRDPLWNIEEWYAFSVRTNRF